MTRDEALTWLHRLARNAQINDLEVQVDEAEMLAFLPDPEEHVDYVFWRAVEANGQWTITKHYDQQEGTFSVWREWLTPHEWREKHHGPRAEASDAD